MAPPPLPQELIDKSIDQFSETATSNGNRTPNKSALASLLIVVRAWKEHSQKHLFSTIDIRKHPPINLTESDLNELAPVFSLTRDLKIDGCRRPHHDLVIATLLRCFRNLESLFLNDWYLTRCSPEQPSAYFNHFGETMTHLKLEGETSSDSFKSTSYRCSRD